MKSAVRWYERAVARKLVGHSKDLALERCVLRVNEQSRSGALLPAGLSAVLRDRQVSGSGVPVRLGMTAAVVDGEQRPWIDSGLPGSVAALGIEHPNDSTAYSKVAREPSSIDERRAASSRSGIIEGREKLNTVVNGQDSSTSSRALSVIEHVMSRPAPADTVLSVPVLPDPATADPLAAVLSSGGKQPVFTEEPQDARDHRIMTTDTGSGSPRPAAVVANMQSRTSAPSRMAAVSMSSGRDALDRYGIVSQAKTAAIRSRPGVVPVENAAGLAAGPSRSIDRVVSGGLDAPRAPADLVLAGIGEGMSDSRFRDPAMEGQDVVPRRAGASLTGNTRMRPQGVDRRPEMRTTLDHVRDLEHSRSAANSPTGSGASPAAQTRTMVSLRGDVMMDGRKMGRVVAAGQTSSASLPTVSGSAINLRALPVFAGTSAAL